MAGRKVFVPGSGFIEGVPDDMSDEEAIGLLTEEERAAIVPALLRTPEQRRTVGVPSAVPGQSFSRAAGRRLRLQQETGVKVLPGQVEDLGARFSAGRITNETLIEKGDALKRALGITDEDIVYYQDPENPSDSAILVRMPGSEGSVELNAPDFFSLADIAGGAGDVLNLSTAASVAAFTATAINPATGAVLRAGASAAGAMAGLFGESELERILGHEQTSRGDVGRQALVLGGLAAGGDAVGELARGVGFFGRGLTPHMPPGVARVVQNVNFLRKRGAKELIGPSPADISPVASTVANGMASQTGLPAKVSRLERFHGILRLIEREIDGLMEKGSKFNLADVERIVGGWSDKLMGAVRGPLKMGPARSGELTLRGVKAFEKARALLHDRLFDKVRKIVVDQDVKLLTGPFKNRVAQLKSGIQGEIEGGAAAASAKKRGKAILFDASGKPLIRSADEALKYQTLVGPNSELGGLMDMFMRLPDEISNIRVKGQLSTSYDQLRGIRTQVFNLMDSPDPVQNRIATRFHEVLTKAMESPVGGNTAYRTALKKANAARTWTERAMSRFNTRELARVLNADPEKLGNTMVTLAHPGRVRDLKGIFTASNQPEKFEMVRQGWMNKILDDPTNAAKTLDAWKAEAPQAFRLLLSETEEHGVREFTEAALKISDGPIGALIQKQRTLGKMAVEAIQSGDTELINMVLASVGGKNSPMGKQMRAGVWLSVIDGATFKDISIEVIKPELVASRITALRKSPGWEDIMMVRREGGRLGLADISDDEIAETIVDLISIFPKEPTAGVGIATAQISSGLYSTGFLKAQFRKSRNAFLNFTLNSALARKAMAARGGFEARLALSVEGGPVRQAAVRTVLRAKSAAHALVQTKLHRNVGYIRPLGIATAIAMREAEEDANTLIGPDAKPTPIIELSIDEINELIPDRILQLR